MQCEWLYATDEMGQTALDRAANSSHMALTEVLLRRYAEDQSTSLDGMSTLHKASFLGLEEAVVCLLAAGEDPDALDKYGETPLCKASRQGHENVVRMLVHSGANVNAADVFGLTPLHWVAMNGRTNIAETLVIHGADPRLEAECLDGLSPMMLAEIMGNDKVKAIFEMFSTLK